MIYHQANCSEFSPLPAVVHFFAHSDGVSVGLNNDGSSHGLVIATLYQEPSVYQQPLRIFSSSTLQVTEATTETGAEYLEGLQTTGLSSTHISRDNWLVDTEGLLCYK